MSALLDKIAKAVERTVKGPVKHRESVPVAETFRGQIVWEGIVEVFYVTIPPPAVAYGWAVESDNGPQYIAVLGMAPADSPLAAVRVWLVSQSKQ